MKRIPFRKWHLLPLGSVLLVSCELLYPLQKTERVDVNVIPPESVKAYPKVSLLPGTAVQDAGEESYLKNRRAAAHADGRQLGVAFSGGGVRSATFCLGALQGMEDAGVLKNVDYLSCVSGGGYIGAWYVSHLRTDAEMARLKQELGTTGRDPKKIDEEIARNFSTVRADLLNLSPHPKCQAVPDIREQSGLLGKGGAIPWNFTKSGAFLTATFVPNLLQDAVVHLQPSPGKWNSLHPIYQYRGLLETYYLKGWENTVKQIPAAPGYKAATYRGPTLLDDINQPHSQTPILISCGALSNSENVDGGKDVDGREIAWDSTNHFEFTHFWCGSPIVGWIPTRYFERSVADVTRNGKDISSQLLRGPLPVRTTPPFRLSSAVAASGAAVDSASFPTRFRPFLNWTLTAVNFNLRYQTANFAQDRTEWYARPLDRLRETTTDRFGRTPRSNVLQISDGAHFENLGVYPLLRRGVSEIYSFDASSDSKYGYDSLLNLLRIIETIGTYEISPGVVHQSGQPMLPEQLRNGKLPPADPVWVFTVRTKFGTSRIHYVKASYRVTDWNSEYANGKNPRWSNLIALNPHGRHADELTRRDYPHISTFALMGWMQPRFDAYRDLGRFLARQVAADVH